MYVAAIRRRGNWFSDRFWQQLFIMQIRHHGEFRGVSIIGSFLNRKNKKNVTYLNEKSWWMNCIYQLF